MEQNNTENKLIWMVIIKYRDMGATIIFDKEKPRVLTNDWVNIHTSGGFSYGSPSVAVAQLVMGQVGTETQGFSKETILKTFL